MKTDKLTFNEITRIITREVMEQYEKLRQLGPCNMYNVNCVCDTAESLEMHDLVEVYGDHYSLIWQNFSDLMRHYGIV